MRAVGRPADPNKGEPFSTRLRPDISQALNVLARTEHIRRGRIGHLLLALGMMVAEERRLDHKRIAGVVEKYYPGVLQLSNVAERGEYEPSPPPPAKRKNSTRRR